MYTLNQAQDYLGTFTVPWIWGGGFIRYPDELLARGITTPAQAHTPKKDGIPHAVISYPTPGPMYSRALLHDKRLRDEAPIPGSPSDQSPGSAQGQRLASSGTSFPKTHVGTSTNQAAGTPVETPQVQHYEPDAGSVYQPIGDKGSLGWDGRKVLPVVCHFNGTGDVPVSKGRQDQTALGARGASGFKIFDQTQAQAA